MSNDEYNKNCIKNINKESYIKSDENKDIITSEKQQINDQQDTKNQCINTEEIETNNLENLKNVKQTTNVNINFEVISKNSEIVEQYQNIIDKFKDETTNQQKTQDDKQKELIQKIGDEKQLQELKHQKTVVKLNDEIKKLNMKQQNNINAYKGIIDGLKFELNHRNTELTNENNYNEDQNKQVDEILPVNINNEQNKILIKNENNNKHDIETNYIDKKFESDKKETKTISLNMERYDNIKIKQNINSPSNDNSLEKNINNQLKETSVNSEEEIIESEINSQNKQLEIRRNKIELLSKSNNKIKLNNIIKNEETYINKEDLHLYDKICNSIFNINSNNDNKSQTNDSNILNSENKLQIFDKYKKIKSNEEKNSVAKFIILENENKLKNIIDINFNKKSYKYDSNNRVKVLIPNISSTESDGSKYTENYNQRQVHEYPYELYDIKRSYYKQYKSLEECNKNQNGKQFIKHQYTETETKKLKYDMFSKHNINISEYINSQLNSKQNLNVKSQPKKQINASYKPSYKLFSQTSCDKQ